MGKRVEDKVRLLPLGSLLRLVAGAILSGPDEATPDKYQEELNQLIKLYKRKSKRISPQSSHLCAQDVLRHVVPDHQSLFNSILR